MFLYSLSYYSLPISVLSPSSSLFNWPRIQLYLKVPNHVCLEVKYYPLRKSMQNFLHGLKASPNFSFFCFHWKLTRHLGKVNKKVKRVSNWIDTQFTSFNVPPCLLPKTTDKLCCRICTIWCMIFKKLLFIEVLCRSLFTKYAHCKPLFPFQNSTSASLLRWTKY